MLGWIKKYWVLSLFLLVGGVPAGLNYSGFCWEQKRWLSDEEKINILISSRFISTGDYIGTVTDFTGDSPVEKKNQSTIYKTLDEFIKYNPLCCRFDVTKAKDTGSPSFLDKIFDRYTNVIFAQYGNNHKDSNGQNVKESVFFINNCGKEARF